MTTTGMELDEALAISKDLLTDDGMNGIAAIAVKALSGGGYGLVVASDLTDRNEEQHEHAKGTEYEGMLPADWQLDEVGDLITSREEFDAWYSAIVDDMVRAAETAAGWDPSP